MQHSTDERGMRAINKEHPDHALFSDNYKIQVYVYLESQLRWNTQKPQCVSSWLYKNAVFSKHGIHSGTPFEIRNTQGNHIHTNFCFISTDCKQNPCIRGCPVYFKISELSSTIKLHSHKLPLEVLMKIAAGSTESGKCSSLLEMADLLSQNAIPRATRCKGNELPPTTTTT